MLSMHEIDTLTTTVGEAVDLALEGKIGDGYAALLAGLHRAREVEAEGEPWGGELVRLSKRVVCPHPLFPAPPWGVGAPQRRSGWVPETSNHPSSTLPDSLFPGGEGRLRAVVDVISIAGCGVTAQRTPPTRTGPLVALTKACFLC
jgi:hypothetical protein